MGEHEDREDIFQVRERRENKFSHHVICAFAADRRSNFASKTGKITE
jgi:hypothetical protein